jgi:c(7)-type cytochrome triheme protein
MFEVAMCVMLYTGVLAAEFSPLVFKRFGLQVPLKIVRAIYIPLVILGVILSTLHQSSLGTLFIIVPDKLHALWYTPLLPVFFLISAIAGGLAMTILESCLSSRAFGRRLEQDILDGLARIIVVVLAVFLVWKIENLAERGALHLVFQVSQESVMFWGEMLLGVLMPMFLFMSARVRASQSGLFLGATLTILGFVVNRLNVSITGFIGSSGVNYIPSWMEFAVTASIVAAGFALFGLAVKHFDVFPEESPIHDAVVPLGCEPEKPFVFHGRALAALWGFLLAGFVIFAVATIWKQSIAETTAPIQQHHGITVNNFAIPEDVEPNLIDDIVLPVGQNSPGAVTFNHSSHVDLDDPSCGGNCHVNSFKMLRDATRQTASDLEDLYECRQCGVCHDGEKSFDRAEDCEMCHETD